MPGAFMLDPRTGRYDPNRNAGIGGNPAAGRGSANDLHALEEYLGDSFYNYNGQDLSRMDPKSAYESYYASGGKPFGAGAPPTGGTGGGSSMFGGTSTFGGKNPFATDAAAAKMRDEYARMKKANRGARNEDSAARGIYSSGVAEDQLADDNMRYDLGLAAGLEGLYNNAAQQELAFGLEQQRMEAAQMANLYGGGSRRYGDANANQQAYEAYGGSTRYGGQQGGGDDRISNGVTQVSGGYSDTPREGETGSPAQRREASSAFFKKYGWWPEPHELEYFMQGGT